jgi:hypothetical protein
MKLSYKVLLMSPVFFIVFIASFVIAIYSFVKYGLSTRFYFSAGGFCCFLILYLLGLFFMKKYGQRN